MTGWLSTLSISNLMGGQGMELWRENLLGVIGGVCNHRRLAPLALGTP